MVNEKSPLLWLGRCLSVWWSVSVSVVISANQSTPSHHRQQQFSQTSLHYHTVSLVTKERQLIFLDVPLGDWAPIMDCFSCPHHPTYSYTQQYKSTCIHIYIHTYTHTYMWYTLLSKVDVDGIAESTLTHNHLPHRLTGLNLPHTFSFHACLWSALEDGQIWRPR